jgi:putative endonuclease
MISDPRAYGKRAESDAERHLLQKGYRILERNVRSAVGELDLVAQTGDTLVFVEVKARRTAGHGGAPYAVGRRKQTRLVRLAAQYLARHRLHHPPCRFDVMLCSGGGSGPQTIEHVENAFEVPGEDLRW